MTPLHVDSRFWLTEQGLATIGREGHVRIDASVKDLCVILSSARIAATLFRHAGSVDEGLEAALDRVGTLITDTDRRIYGGAA